jgi:peptidoglycan/LPS O-acetylase OafA/YrhL
VGRRSYGTYLVHQPILDGEWLSLGRRLAVAAAGSALFALGCERPFERLAQRLGRRPTAGGSRAGHSSANTGR